ncbi:inovirus Gp2 family protein [Shewanella algae]|uniref:inovirus Gp2 family protein n=1 Tax=Shewanella algae TaxID=38313 RepID=UPI001AADCB0D|nr:inovirus Gp2 family protein [Shewanella algae]MBO2576334.1 inovirus Gp2 family protein [Shewanella algae]MBO2643862.1 inovirus Gp2 family protein [Shewanella algae]QTE95360.1 inovirus Gp2 family protein [Shewanella algae]
MQRRHPSNPNLIVVNCGQFQNLSVYPKPLSKSYLEAIFRTLNASLNEHPRTFMVRFDLHLPQLNFIDSPMLCGTSVISRFFKSLNAKIQHDRESKRREGKRVHPCTLRYIWAKERAEAATDHYHVAIFLNNDAYSHLGCFGQSGRNLRTKIIEAWASAIGLDEYNCKGLVHFPLAKPMYYLNCNDADFSQEYESAFYRLSYLAKLETKHFGDRTRSFGCSQWHDNPTTKSELVAE